MLRHNMKMQNKDAPSENISSYCVDCCQKEFSTGYLRMGKEKAETPQYTVQDSKLLVTVVCFAELVETCLWYVGTERYAPNRPDQQGKNQM